MNVAAGAVFAAGPRTLVGYVNLAVWLAFLALMAIALLACLLRPDGDFVRAQKPKRFWIVILGAGTLVVVWNYLFPFYLPFGSWLRLAAVIAAVYYLGPEQQRMGPRGRGRGGGRNRRSHGGW